MAYRPDFDSLFSILPILNFMKNLKNCFSIFKFSQLQVAMETAM